MTVDRRLTSGAYKAVFEAKGWSVKVKDDNIYDVSDDSLLYRDALKEVAASKNAVVCTPIYSDALSFAADAIADKLCKKQRVLVVGSSSDIKEMTNSFDFLKNKTIFGDDFNLLDFYARLRVRNNNAVEHKKQFDELAYSEILKAIEKEAEFLLSAERTFNEPNEFGLSMIEMYNRSGNMGLNTIDKSIDQNLQANRVSRLNYSELATAIKSIKEGNKASKYYERALKEIRNPFINYIRNDLGASELDNVLLLIRKMLNENTALFNFSANTYGRITSAYVLEAANRHTKNSKNRLTPLADLLMRVEHPDIVKWFLVGLIPPLLPLSIVYGIKYYKKRKSLLAKLEAAASSFDSFSSRFNFLRNAVNHRGYALITGSLMNANNTYLKQLAELLEDYANIRDLNITRKSLTQDEHAVLEFAYANTKNERFFDLLDSIIDYRIYDEVQLCERQGEGLNEISDKYLPTRNQLLQLDKKRREMNSKLLNDNDESYVPFFQKNAEKGEAFLAEINKKENRLPTRELINQYSEFILRLLPCFAVTVEEARAVLPRQSELFDTVVFLNASTITSSDAAFISEYAKSILVLGDNMGNGLPSEVKGSENLWEIASKCFKPINLEYVAQRVNPVLSTFSNSAFYSGRLRCAPSLARLKVNEVAEVVKVDGNYKEGKNLDEAKAVVDQIKRALRKGGEKQSIGVVAFDEQHLRYINELCEQEFRRSESYKKLTGEGSADGIYFKNAHELRFDKRDLIIMSTAVSPNAIVEYEKSMAAGFENALNSAIAQAGKKLVLITSVTPQDLNKGKTSALKTLGEFIRFATHTALAKEGEIKKLAQSQKSEDATLWNNFLKDELERMGYTVELPRSESPRISIGVYDKESAQFVLGIVWDFDAFTAGSLERELADAQVLSAAGWRILRIWSRDFWQNRAQVVKMIEKELAQAKRNTVTLSKDQVPTVRIKPKKGATIEIDPFDEAAFTKVLKESEDAESASNRKTKKNS